MMFSALLLLSTAVALAASADLGAKYPFSSVLYDNNGEYYGLHWNFTLATESIYFAVNVSTTGWVGFGLSPNGMMPGSDVVIGWVNGEQSYFHDRFAEGRYLPSIDESQDWFLVNSEEEDGFTVLEFSRNFTTCDTKDLDITASTSRVVWSFSITDPTGPNGAGALQHDFVGSRSLNLISGQPNGNSALPENQPSLAIEVSNVVIPDASTTYFCESFRLPPGLINNTHYITRFSPQLTAHERPYVHHILVYLCAAPLPNSAVGVSMPCNTLPEDASSCRTGLLVGAWAIGGEDFIYPEGIAYPIGGNGDELFIVMEMHYDNPGRDNGVVDNSGLRFYYTTEVPANRAGILEIGHAVTPAMVIPPRTKNYTIVGICPSSCTSESIPEGGINIFANLLHTHVVGSAIVIEHYRYNDECNVLEELEPIDFNLKYDFNYQQFTHLQKEHKVLPGDTLVLKCYYDTSNVSTVTLGGESTLEEMCLSFPVFYPRPADGSGLSRCLAFPGSQYLTPFYFYLLNNVSEAAADGLVNNPLPTLNGLDWQGDPQLAIEFEKSILESSSSGRCTLENGQRSQSIDTLKVPQPKCSYLANDKCSKDTPKTCCERLATDGAAPQIHLSMVLTFLMVPLGLLLNN